MFGMEKLQNELVALNKEKAQAAVVLEQAQADVAAKNQSIRELDEQIKASAAEKAAIENQLVSARQNYEEAKGQLQHAQTAVGELSQAKQSLEGEVNDLEQMTERLRRGILAIREGQVVFRSGEVVYAGVLKGGLNDEENNRQMQLFLATANEVALHRMGIEAEEPVQAIWMPNEVIEEALSRVKASPGNIFVRVRTVANIIAGEPAVCTLELAADNRVYKNNELIFSKEIDLKRSESSMNGEILEFLADINRVAVAAGVIPDPLTGKVGNMDAGTMVETGEKMAKYGGKVLLKAYAKGDINASGPVLLRLEVEMPKNKLWYLGVDPGSAKTGVAWLEDDGTITKTAVIATEKLAAALPQIFSEGPAAVILGNGTNSANVKTMLAAAASGTDIVTVEESYSTEDARQLYWQENPPLGWRKLVPLGLQVPPVNLDGYAAAVLVRRYLKQK